LAAGAQARGWQQALKLSRAQSVQAPQAVPTPVSSCSLAKSRQPLAISRAISLSDTLWQRQMIMAAE